MPAHWLKELAVLGDHLERELPLDDLLSMVTEATARLLHANRTSLRLLDASHSRLLASCRSGHRPSYADVDTSFKIGEGLVGWIAKHGQPLLLDEAETDARFVRRDDMPERLGAFVGVPLRIGANTIGVLSALHGQLGFFSSEHLDLLHVVAALAAPRIEIQRLARLSRVDPLTGALNRVGFDALLPPEFEPVDVAEVVIPETVSNKQLSVISLDIDRFKLVNDTFGHSAGDEALKAVVRVLVSVLRSSDAVIRMGGEEFLVVLPGAGLKHAQRVAERARFALESTVINTHKQPIQVTASFGVAERVNNETRESLLERADSALYEAKEAGRNRVVVSHAPPTN